MKLSGLTDEQCVSLLASAEKNASFKYHEVWSNMVSIYAGHPRFGEISISIDDDGDMECSIGSTGDAKFFNAVAVVDLLREWRVEGFVTRVTFDALEADGWTQRAGGFSKVMEHSTWRLQDGMLMKFSNGGKLWEDTAPKSMEDLQAIIRAFDTKPWQTSVTHVAGEDMSEETMGAIAEMAKVAFKTTTEIASKDGR